MQDNAYNDELETAKFDFVCAYDDGLNPDIAEWAARFPQYPELAEWFAEYVDLEQRVALMPEIIEPSPAALRAVQRGIQKALREIGIVPIGQSAAGL